MLRGEDKSGAQECRTTQTKSIFRTREFSSDACRRRLRKWEVVQEAPDCEEGNQKVQVSVKVMRCLREKK